MFSHENAVRARLGDGCAVAGVDEVGRGPLAGPVVVAAVILPSESEFSLPVNDSKKLTARKRDELAEALKADERVHWALAWRSAARIDEVNILRATHEAMREAACSLVPRPDFVLIDGLPVPDYPFPAEFIVKGDSHSASIAAASILAKTYRDHLMDELDKVYPQYGFADHKGYGTAAHLAALAKYGPCPEHRRSFAPVRNCLCPPPEQQLLPF